MRLASAAALGTLAAPLVVRSARAATVVRLAQVESLSGPSSAYGIRGRDGAQFAVDEINAAGGFTDAKGNSYTLQIGAADMASDAPQAVTLFRQHALNQGISAQIGPVNSTGFIPVVPLAEQLRMVLVGLASAPIRRWTPWAYRVNPVSSTTTPLFLRKVVSVVGIKRLGLIFDQTQEGQVGDAEVVRRMQPELGYEVVVDEAFKGGDQDYSPQIAKMRNARLDAVYVAAPVGDGVRITNQMRGVGIDAALVTGFGSFQDPTYWDGTNGLIRDGYTWLAQDLKGASGHLREFLTGYNAKNRLEATSFSTYGYDAVYAVVEAVRRAGDADRGKIREALSSLDFTTPIGTRVTFRNPPNGENLTPTATVIRITGRGEYEVV
jgi:branched-chain amino acid transport system substrate-binding protein